MNKLAELVGYMQDMMVHLNGKAQDLDAIAKAKGKELRRATVKKQKELTAVVAQCHKEGTEAMMYCAFAESMCDLAYEIAKIKGIDLDKDIQDSKLQRLQGLKVFKDY